MNIHFGSSGAKPQDYPQVSVDIAYYKLFLHSLKDTTVATITVSPDLDGYASVDLQNLFL